MSKDKTRIYQLAQELKVSSKELIDLLQASGVDAKSQLTTLDGDQQQLARDLVSGKVKPQSSRSGGAAVVEESPPPSRSKVEPPVNIPDPSKGRPGEIPRPKMGKPSAIPEQTPPEDFPPETSESTQTSPLPESVPAEESSESMPAAVTATPKTSPSGSSKRESSAPVVTPPAADSEIAETPSPAVASAPQEREAAAKAPSSPSSDAGSRPERHRDQPGRSDGPQDRPERTERPERAKRPAPRVPIPDPSRGGMRVLSQGPGERTGSKPGGGRDRREMRRPGLMVPPPVMTAPGGAGTKTEPPKDKGEVAQKPLVRYDHAKHGAGVPPVPVEKAKEPGTGFTEGGTEEDRGDRNRGGRGASGNINREDRRIRRNQRAAQRERFDVDGEDESGRPRDRGLHRGHRDRRNALNRDSGKGPVILQMPITLRSFSEATGIRTGQLMGKLMGLNIMVTINGNLTEEEAQMLAMEMDLDVQVKREETAETWFEDTIVQAEDAEEHLLPRSPVVTFMGHVDHGKTSLMDRIRSANVAQGESGGITQHVGAYQVKFGDRAITFLDTPGHEAFTAMRARGADATDIVVLVVAADDGVMPQTEEAINHAKAADVAIVVALNKMDLPGANPDRVKQQLSGLGLQPEEWGGDTIMVGTSAATGAGIDDLLESLNIVAELKELKANPDRAATGLCIEASLSEGLGSQCTMLVQNGTLRRGDVLICGSAFGRVRAMFDEHGTPLEEAGPSTPALLTGLDSVPEAGEKFFCMDDLSKAREIAEDRKSRIQAETRASRVPHINLQNLVESMQQRKLQELLVIIKADVRGSLEAIRKEMADLVHDEVKVRIIHDGLGGVGESDVLLADASDAIIIAYRVVPDDRAESMASEKGVEIRRYEIIYQVTDEIKKALEGMLQPESREVQLGKAVVQETFTISRIGTVAGCRVVQGTIERNAKTRLIRDGAILGTYAIDALKRFKDDVKDVREGLECGIKLANFNDVKRGDVFEAYKIEEIKRSL